MQHLINWPIINRKENLRSWQICSFTTTDDPWFQRRSLCASVTPPLRQIKTLTGACITDTESLRSDTMQLWIINAQWG
ncbi:hypothetical protein SKAU_G00203490 [Synaphobranchus kaupii]|uniref:Uncharacterized protein n=1 Tax=Synaphobranchus kaupii TaxID=118154 RepID=A0A9Q1FFX7_SYNKA|nr:hypothetical protein SKAU_G00203490 [Synaphobranchus kaupii]